MIQLRGIEKAELGGSDRFSVSPYFRVSILERVTSIFSLQVRFYCSIPFTLLVHFQGISKMIEKLKNVVVIGGSYVGLVCPPCLQMTRPLLTWATGHRYGVSEYTTSNSSCTRVQQYNLANFNELTLVRCC